MHLEWLEDIVAVIDTGSFSAAAERRNVTQPAFSRRIRAIEQQLGAELFDRDRKPVAMHPLAAHHQDEFRRLLTEMRELLLELRRQGREAQGRVVVASQHALTATFAPPTIGSLLQRIETSVRLRSANRDECLAMLMTKQVDLLINYQTAAEVAADPLPYLERIVLGAEDLIPVSSIPDKDVLAVLETANELPVIAYPSDAFLGRLFNEDILPRLPGAPHVRRKVETALTLAALEFACKGIGVAWVPANLVRKSVVDGSLHDLRAFLPFVTLSIVALRLAGEQSEAGEQVWHEIVSHGAGAGGVLCPPET